MGYACPVCEVPQRDGEHLAHHLAFTAMLHGDEHADWLDEHAPDWAESTPEELAERAVEHAPEAEYEEVFEDTVDRAGGGRGRPSLADANSPEPAAGGADGEAEEVLAEARELTRELLDARAERADGDGDDEDESDRGDGDGDESDRGDGDGDDGEVGDTTAPDEGGERATDEGGGDGNGEGRTDESAAAADGAEGKES